MREKHYELLSAGASTSVTSVPGRGHLQAGRAGLGGRGGEGRTGVDVGSFKGSETLVSAPLFLPHTARSWITSSSLTPTFLLPFLTPSLHVPGPWAPARAETNGTSCWEFA